MESKEKARRKTATHDKKLSQAPSCHDVPKPISEEQRRILIELLNSAKRQQNHLSEAVKQLSELLDRRKIKPKDNKTDK
ncbi:MAG: hypothetical protein OSJ36_08180 [Odoribacter sp.]|nr:hypothetical protein [Odoribacter sp.]